MLYIVSGGIFHTDSTIKGEGKVTIPDSCYKIVVILERGHGLKDVTANTEIISVVMPNIDGIRSDEWEKCKTTVDKIEFSAGYNFLTSVAKEIQIIVEKK